MSNQEESGSAFVSRQRLRWKETPRQRWRWKKPRVPERKVDLGFPRISWRRRSQNPLYAPSS